MTPNPVEPRHAVRNWSVAAAVLIASVFVAWRFSRVANGAPDAHDHTAPATTDSVRQPVMLTGDAAQRIGVTYAVAERGTLAPEARTVAVVTYDETRVKTIAPKIDGWVEELLVAYTGQVVGDDDPLLRIYSPMLVTAQEELLLAARLAAEVATADSVTARNAQALLAGARRRLRYWDIPEADITRIEQTGVVERTLTLRSPIKGIVVRKDVLAGQRIMAGDAVYQVADLGEVWLEGEVFERDLAAMQVGARVTAEFAALPGERIEGRVIFIAPTVTAETRTTVVRVALSNDSLRLKPGMYATIHAQGRARANAVHDPRSSVLSTGQRTLVFVRMADGMLTPRDVVLGASTNDRVEVLRGLSAGETVVASATFLIDAESNLGAALGAMAAMPGMPDMPGMDMTPPASPARR